jgi:hypothetical protein
MRSSVLGKNDLVPKLIFTIKGPDEKTYSYFSGLKKIKNMVLVEQYTLQNDIEISFKNQPLITLAFYILT